MSTEQYLRYPSLSGGSSSANVAFLAYAHLSQTIPNFTITNVVLDRALYNTGGYFDTSTYTFTPKVSGWYFVSFNLNWLLPTNGSTGGAYIYKNGASTAQAIQSIQPNLYLCQSVNTYTFMNGSTDYLNVYASITGNGGAALDIDVGQQVTYFYSYLVLQSSS